MQSFESSEFSKNEKKAIDAKHVKSSEVEKRKRNQDLEEVKNSPTSIRNAKLWSLLEKSKENIALCERVISDHQRVIHAAEQARLRLLQDKRVTELAFYHFPDHNEMRTKFMDYLQKSPEERQLVLKDTVESIKSLKESQDFAQSIQQTERSLSTMLQECNEFSFLKAFVELTVNKDNLQQALNDYLNALQTECERVTQEVENIAKSVPFVMCSEKTDIHTFMGLNDEDDVDDEVDYIDDNNNNVDDKDVYKDSLYIKLRSTFLDLKTEVQRFNDSYVSSKATDETFNEHIEGIKEKSSYKRIYKDARDLYQNITGYSLPLTYDKYQAHDLSFLDKEKKAREELAAHLFSVLKKGGPAVGLATENLIGDGE